MDNFQTHVIYNMQRPMHQLQKVKTVNKCPFNWRVHLQALQHIDDMCLKSTTSTQTIHFHKCCKSRLKKGFFRLTEQEFTFLGTITLVLLCQPKTIKPWKEIQHNNIFKLRGKNTLADIIMYYWPQKEKPSRITIIKTTFKNVPKTNSCPKTMKRKAGKQNFQFSSAMICDTESMLRLLNSQILLPRPLQQWWS